MPLIGIVAKKKDIQTISKEVNNVEIVQITEESIENLKNIKFDEIIFLEDIKIKKDAYKYMSEIISNVKYLIINADIDIKILREVSIKEPISLITFGFNPKSTVTISSVNEDKIIVCVQRNITKTNQNIIETQEKEIKIDKGTNRKIYNNLSVFIIKELHNL